MNKQKIKSFNLDLYSEVLDNGLTVNIVPKKNVNNIYVTFSSKYGSIHSEFIPIDQKEFYKSPLGVAHFLEHKVFATEDEVDPFVFFSSNGADANANTSNYKTTYLFSSPSNFKKNINYLLDFVQTPYFTDENVEKEKGIIIQELKMLADRPYWRLYESVIDNSFINHPIKYPVGGTIKSVKSITKEDLYTCYNTFYHPANMFLTISGNVDPNEAIKIIKENQKNKKYPKFKKIIHKQIEEPNEVFKKRQTLKRDITIPKAAISYKINKKKYDIYELKRYLNMYLSILLGSTSIFDEDVKKSNILDSGVTYEIINTDKHILLIIDFETENYEEVIKRIKNIVGKSHIDKVEFERKKKTLISSYIYRSDNIYAINSKIDSNIINFNEVILDDFDIINKMSFETLNNIIDDLNFDNTNIVVINKK